MSQDENDHGPDDQQGAPPEATPAQTPEAGTAEPAAEAAAEAVQPAAEPEAPAEPVAEAAAEPSGEPQAPQPPPVAPAPPPARAARPVSVRPPARPSAPPPPEFVDDGKPEAGQRRLGRFSRRNKLIFAIGAVIILAGGGTVGFLILYEQHQAKICAEARATNDPGTLRECWNCSTQDQWKPTVIHRIANSDQVDNLDILTSALQGGNMELAAEAANAFLYLAQSPDENVRAKVAALKDSVLKKRMDSLKGTKDEQGMQARALLGVALVYMSDVDGLEPAMVEATVFNYSAYSESMIGNLANRDSAFFDGLMKLAERDEPTIITRVLGALEKVDYTAGDAEAEGHRERVVTRLKAILSGNPEPDVEVAAILCWSETGDEGALQRVAEYFDRAAALENAEAPTEREEAQDLQRRAEQLFNKVKLRYGADKLVDLYRLIKKNRHRQERILYLVRQLHDPREKIRQFLLEAVEKYAPKDGDFGEHVDDQDQLTHAGTLYVNAVFGLAELLDARAVGPLQTILNKFSTMVRITDEQANLYNAGLMILGSIAVREGPPLEEDVARYIFELSDPRKYPERWTEKRAGKLRVLSFVAGDIWDRFLVAHPECRDDLDPATTLVKPVEGCVSAVDLRSELAPPPGTEVAPVVEAPKPPEEMTEAEKELAKRAERLREFEEGEKTLEDTKKEELSWVFDTGAIDLKAKVYYFVKVFACPIEITMDAAMMDRNDQRVKEYERWCGDYSPATESLARLAHKASDSFRREARQYLADRLDKTFLKYPGTQEVILYNQNMSKEIYTFVRFREAVAKSLGYLGTADPKLIEALKTVAFDENDHPQVGLPAGKSLGIVADAQTLDEIVDGFVSEDLHPDVRGYLLSAIEGHFRFAPLNDLAPKIPDAENRAIDKLATFLARYEGGLQVLPSNRLFLLGALFGSMATNPTVAGKVVDLTRGPDARVREIALLALICSAAPDTVKPVFDEVYGTKTPEPNVAQLKTQITLKTLRDIFMNVGTPNVPYTIPVRSEYDIADESLFRRLKVLHDLADLGQKEFLDYFTMRLALALGTDKDAADKAAEEAGSDAADSYTPIAYKLAYKDNFTYYETPYLTWTDLLYKFASSPDKNIDFRKFAVELLWRIDERGFVYAIYADTSASGRSNEDDRRLHDYIFESVMREYR
ncbi:MAG: hypothetical protein HY905_09465 [Deltaproteobacteria bacterium]|nr:hypothetical protein [Deltaproteobacteria bacterium]